MMLDDDCLFCKIIRRDIPADVVFEDDLVLAFRDISPQAPHHVLIVPKEHIPTTNDIGPLHDGYLAALFAAARAIASDLAVADGYRLVLNCGESAGQSVFHLHMHLLGGRAMRWPPG
jgi:histidine triad (HIT) family protein